MIPPEEQLREGIKYIDAQTPERMVENPVLEGCEEALAEAAAKGKR